MQIVIYGIKLKNKLKRDKNMGRVCNLKVICEIEDKAILALVRRFASKLKSVERKTNTKISPDPLKIADKIKKSPDVYVQFTSEAKSKAEKILDDIEIRGGTPLFRTMFKQSLQGYIHSLKSLENNGKKIDIKLLLKPFLQIDVEETN